MVLLLRRQQVNISSSFPLFVFTISLFVMHLCSHFSATQWCTIYWHFLLSLALLTFAFTKSPALPKLPGCVKTIFKNGQRKGRGICFSHGKLGQSKVIVLGSKACQLHRSMLDQNALFTIKVMREPCKTYT